MDPLTLILFLAAAGIVLFIGEMLLPTHGVLGVLGGFCLVGAIGVCFYMNRWAGLFILIAAVVTSPMLIGLAMNLWARSPIGRRIILQPPQSTRSSVPIALGEQGIAVTELRPIGECDFGERRIEAASELGIISAGQKVKVVAINQGRPTVRAVQT